jgi:hypothetical protein
MSMTTSQKMYHNLQKEAQKAGTTVTALCRATGTAISVPSHWKTGETGANTKTYDRLMEAAKNWKSEARTYSI